VSARLAIHLAPHELPELQRAARTLLGHPLVTASYPTPDALALVRRWETVLRNEFAQRFGYRLDVGRTSARLLRRPSALTSLRPARRDNNGRAFVPWAYAFMCLALAAAEQSGRQVLASELVERIEQRARGDAELPVDLKVHAQRRALVDALDLLDRLGVITARDGDIESLMGEGQVLFDIDREALGHCLVASPSVLREVRTTADFLVEARGDAPDAATRAARHAVNRRLVDQPVVLFDELSADESEMARRNRRREAEGLTRLTGCEVELRREGMAVIDVTAQRLGGRPFPTGGTEAHAALLWLAALVDAVRPDTDIDADGDADDLPAEVLCSAATLDDTWNAVFEHHGTRFRKQARERPAELRAAATDLLVHHGLIRKLVDGGVAVRAVAARFRVEVNEVLTAVSADVQEQLW
jgi:uncharacterized protein (TIGR02678 family)